MTKVSAFIPGHGAPSSDPRSATGAKGTDPQATFLEIIAQQIGASVDSDKPNHSADAATPFAQLSLFQQAPSDKTDGGAAAARLTEIAASGPALAQRAIALEAAHHRSVTNASPISAPPISAPPTQTLPARSPAAQTRFRRPSSGVRIDMQPTAPPEPSRHATPSAEMDHLAARAPVMRARAHINPVFVALHATDNEFAVYARAGRMAPTERARLRNAVTVLLAEYGHFDVPVRLDEQAGGDRWRK
jgi:hypothetical protein